MKIALWLFLLLLPVLVFAQDECEPRGERPDEMFSSSWSVQEVAYQCGNNECGGTVKQKTVEEETVTRTFYTPETDPETHCPIWKENTNSFSNGTTPASIVDVPLGKYQACPASANNAWSSSNPAQCSGQCYPAPKTLPLNHESLQPKNVFDGEGTLKLPLRVAWQENVEQELASSSCKVEKYAYTIGPVSAETTERQAMPGGNECALAPNTSYEFTVRACAGNTCGKPSEKLPVTTSNAVQLISPYDPDWENGSSSAQDITGPVLLTWCQKEDDRSYKLRIYIAQDDNITCHPQFALSGGSCEAKLIEKIKRPPPFESEAALLPEFFDTKGIFTKSTTYLWEIASCLFEGGAGCSDFSQQWKFRTSQFELQQTTPFSPPNDPAGQDPVGLPLILRWEEKPGLNLYQYEVKKVSTGETISEITSLTQSAALYFPLLSLDTVYQWRIRGCSKFSAVDCRTNWEDWTGEERTFKTTGAAPTALTTTPVDSSGHVLIPAAIAWNAVGGAKSYGYEISRNSSFTNLSEVGTVGATNTSIDYPRINMDRDYWWRVKTCADSGGTTCGAWSNREKFHTFTLKNPTAPLIPENGKEFWTYQDALTWNAVPDAKAYQYTVRYGKQNPPPDETNSLCEPLAGTAIVSNAVSQYPLVKPELRCLGGYEWEVVSCLDVECKEKSTASPATWTFTYAQPPPPALPGLLVCGRLSNHPDTPYNEHDTCEFKHLFLLLHNVTNFALWKLSIILIVLMTVLTGVVMYTSFGGLEVLAQVKSIWKAIGVGILILLFSWLLLNLLLGIIGFDINIFGRWYELPN